MCVIGVAKRKLHFESIFYKNDNFLANFDGTENFGSKGLNKEDDISEHASCEKTRLWKLDVESISNEYICVHNFHPEVNLTLISLMHSRNDHVNRQFQANTPTYNGNIIFRNYTTYDQV